MKNNILVILTILFFSNSYAQCGQYVENKLSALSDVRFWDQDNGFVIGGSSLLTTHDGGDSWKTYKLPHNQSLYYHPLNDIELVDTNKAFVFGADGIILFTENKGVDWERRVGIHGLENFTGVDFVNSDLGYLVGVNNYLADETAFLYKTIDGGETWLETTSNISSINSGDFRPKDVLFLNKNTGFVWGGSKLYKTIDGGETWGEENNPSNSYINRIQFIDAQTAYLSGGDRIYKTSDGGNSWTQTSYAVEWSTGAFTVSNNFLYYSRYVANGIKKVNVNGGSGDSVRIDQAGFLTDIYFVNDTVGFAVGRKEQGSPLMGRFIYKTTDAGLSWEQLDSGSPQGSNSNSATYFKKISDGEYVFSVVSRGNDTHSSILLSQDKGASWKEIYKTEDVAGYTLYAKDDYISHWRYSNSNNYGQGYIISESYDKGATWTDGPILNISDLPADVNYVVRNLTQVSENDLYIYGFGNIYHSTDKGVTWNLIPTPNEVSSREYQFIDENNFMLYGSSSTNSEPIVYKTNDGGTTWDFVAQVSGSSYSLQDDRFDFNANTICFYPRSAGNKIFIYDILNQNLIENTTPYSISKLRAIENGGLIILDQNQDLYISHDNGQTWSQRFWANYNYSYPNIYVEDKDNIFLWEYNFIQSLKKYIPSQPELISGSDDVLTDTEEEYIIPADLFSATEWILEGGGSLIIDENTSYYKAKVLWETEGEHTLKVKRITDCGESAFTEIKVIVNPKLIPENSYAEQFVVYPNPFGENINIAMPKKFKNEKLSITITNMLGQMVYRDQQAYSTPTIELNNISRSISSGVYFLKVESGKTSFTKKIIKK